MTLNGTCRACGSRQDELCRSRAALPCQMGRGRPSTRINPSAETIAAILRCVPIDQCPACGAKLEQPCTSILVRDLGAKLIGVHQRRSRAYWLALASAARNRDPNRYKEPSP